MKHCMEIPDGLNIKKWFYNNFVQAVYNAVKSGLSIFNQNCYIAYPVIRFVVYEMVTLFLEQFKAKQNLIVLIHKKAPAVNENKTL